jgi:phospholipid/cholesterol/gamma-HCH transport system ATP-binding protein
LIRFVNVSKKYGDEMVLDKVSFEVQTGERVSLIGPGGCGKTTMLKILLGLEKPDAGSAYLFDTDMSHAEEQVKQDTLRKVGMAFQQGGLFDFMTVRENLFFAMEHMTQHTPEEMETKLKILLEGVKLPWTSGMFPHELSGGMKRRVGIARALCTDPEIAIFDEPTAGLDPVTSTIILNMINDLSGANQNTSLLVATSNVEIAIRFADRLIVMHDAKIEADGPWRELLLSGIDWVRNFLSVRLIGLDIEYAKGLDLPKAFLKKHWSNHEPSGSA